MKLSGFMTVSLMLLLLTGCGTSERKVEENYVHCRSLAGDRTAVKLFEWEFNALSDALLATCNIGDELTAVEIKKRVSAVLKSELRESLQDPGAGIETTLLELEVRGIFAKAENDKHHGQPTFRRTM